MCPSDEWAPQEPRVSCLYADIVFPLPIAAPLTYSVPSALQHRIVPGMRAIAPVQSRVHVGYVVKVTQTTDRTDLRPLLDLPDDEPLFSKTVLDLCAWVAEYYCCSLGEALQCAAPPGLHLRMKRRYVLDMDRITAGRFTERQRHVVEALYRRGALSETDLARVVGSAALSATLHSLLKRGIIREAPPAVVRGASMRTELYVSLIEEGVPNEADLLALQKKAPRQAAVYLDLLHGEPERPAPLLYEKHGACLDMLRALQRKGLVRLEERECYRIPTFGEDENARIKPVLNDEQQAAYESIVRAVEAGAFQCFLLQGITGSGKTEVYLQAVERALASGRNAIILVPEISLTPQTVARFKARFQADIAVLHSGLGAGERYDEWRRARRGDVRIVVGARSAVFAPLADVGIIVVDEEHDVSYKQTDVPRYHARDVAVVRAKLSGAVCVLGSATPSIESYYNTECGKSMRLTLTRRAVSASLPQVEIIDMRAESREVGGPTFLSRKLEEAVRERMESGDQVLLLLNRRGFAPFVLCPMCGWTASCSDCHVSLTYHAKGAVLSCHYCSARRSVPQACEECGFAPPLFLGVGTQKVEDLLTRTFPDRRIERMDSDTTSGKGGHAKILGRLAAREIDILVGTQMIAKGHDYPGVTLVGVLNADTGLGFPDFRAAEHTFQLLTQVAGRAGRGDRPGQVFIQTYRPRHYAIQCAAAHDYAAFYDREISEREAAGYPPYRRMANLCVESEDLFKAERAAAAVYRLARQCRSALDLGGAAILGPAPATVPRVRRKYRWNIAFLCRSARRLNALVRAVAQAYANEPGLSGADLKIDLDPYGAF